MERDSLKHYGVLGMKWGIRRYQNYDGSYTQAGMKRYNASKSKYDAARSEYESSKKSGNKYQTKAAKSKMKTAERQMKKDYKHLSIDKKADEGKLLYSEGRTISETYATKRAAKALNSFGSMALLTAVNMSRYRIGEQSTRRILAQGGAAMLAVGGALTVKSKIDDSNNKKLRAYYGHTSNY